MAFRMLLLALCATLLVAAPARAASDELMSLEYAPSNCTADSCFDKLRVGVLSFDVPPLMSNSADGVSLTSFEGALLKDICDAMCAECEVVLLPNIDSRITALQNGTVDFVLSAFSVTEERAELVDFVKPYYYAAGTALFLPEGKDYDQVSWKDADDEGLKVCLLEGYYVADKLEAKYKGIQWVPAANEAAQTSLLADGSCVGYVFDSTEPPRDGFRAAEGLRGIELQFAAPYTLPVAKGNASLRRQLGGVVAELLTKPFSGARSAIEQLERDLLEPVLGIRLPYLTMLSKYVGEYVDSEDMCKYQTRITWGRR